ncbi:hypothetical protein SAMN05444410_106144 [Hydrobacter penzbergensis]|uniref:Uncharacterized protein n=1 Tax=Hydrobacter penzbergensis TaxID=1235997 RepID=A0A8X8IC88_9BACT|nr:hypothetical protein [Hydrobacter penzbergensis]SDW85648.1 hypothetical protein SAMN05444410_106144 [Hydrobacter penzbergensis]
MPAIAIMKQFNNFQQYSICFFFPYHEVSGVPVLFSRMANTIIDQYPFIDVSIIDYNNGAIARNFTSNDKVRIIEFKDGQRVSPPDDCVLIMQSILPYAMRPELLIKPKTKILLWTLHPENLVPILIPLPGLRNIQNHYFQFYKTIASLFFRKRIKLCKEYIRIANIRKGLYFMDGPNFEKTIKYLFLDRFDVDFLPVPSVPSLFKEEKTINTDVIYFCWVGRLCDFKSHILIHTLKKLSTIAAKTQKRIYYYVIGEGPFRERISMLNIDNHYFKLDMKGPMTPDALDRFLATEVNVLTAMGTSALEGAKLAIPTILLDISYYPIKGDYLFRWLHDTKDYDLGHDISSKDYVENNSSLETMFLSLFEQYEELSRKAFEYFKNNHDIGVTARRLVSAIEHTNFAIENVPPYLLKRTFLRKLYDKMRGFN